MNRKLISCLAVSAALSAGSAFAGVTLTAVETAVTSSWSASFGGGTLSASLLATASGNAVAETINTATTDFGQSFKGDGKVLEGWAFYGNGNNGAAVIYTIKLLDFGTAGPIDTYAEFNPVVPASVLLSDAFTLSNGPAGQLYFDFTGGSTVTLQSNHYYAMAITATTGTAFFTRVSGGNSTYADGTGAKGLGVLNPDAFAGAGALRDTTFALYTTAAAIPEPSTYAAIVGALALAGVALRRRRA